MQQAGNWIGTATLYIFFALALIWTLSTLSQAENLLPDHETIYATNLLVHIPPNSTDDAYHIVSFQPPFSKLYQCVCADYSDAGESRPGWSINTLEHRYV